MSELRETLSAIRMFGLPQVLYWRLIYRHHMRFIHKRGGHQLKVRQIDGAEHCSWCGHLIAKDGAVITDGPAMKKRLDEMMAEYKRTGILGAIPSGLESSSEHPAKHEQT